MSKQQTEVVKLLQLIYPDLQTEVTLNKITNYLTHKHIRVDIWIPCIRCVVEVHGIQHFKPSGFGKDKIQSHLDFMEQTSRDNRLQGICSRFNLNYEQIDYTDKVNIAFLYKKFSKYLSE